MRSRSSKRRLMSARREPTRGEVGTDRRLAQLLELFGEVHEGRIAGRPRWPRTRCADARARLRLRAPARKDGAEVSCRIVGLRARAHARVLRAGPLRPSSQ